MKLNVSKCSVVRFTKKKQPLLTDYCMEQIPLSIVSEYKYLGVVINSTLSWNDHVRRVSVKASRVLNFLRRNFRTAPFVLKQVLYVSNVRPILEYACTAWDPATKVNIDALERIQKRAARFVTGDYNFTRRSSEIVSALGWPLLSSRRKYIRLCLFYNIINDKTGIDKNKYIKPPAYISSRRDHSLKVREYNCRTSAFANTFFPKTIHEWKSSVKYCNRT
uniref:Tick transposon n=1 Tax=Rhipicephalus zambeziensis TaxID=60191 RepID=A0A224Z198_9ACAR